MISTTEFSELLELIYAAAEEPSAWGEFLDRSAEHLGAQSCSLMLLDREDLRQSLLLSGRIDSKLALEMREWAARDIWVQNAAGSPLWSQPGRVVESQEVVPDAMVLKSEYYNEYLVRAGFSQTMSCLLFADPLTAGSLNFYYSQASGLRTPEQLELARRLTPHVQRALRLHQSLGSMKVTGGALAGSFDRLGSGFVLLNANGRVLSMNRTAETMLQRQDGLQQRSGLLAATVPQDDDLLRTIVRAAARTTAGSGLSSGGMLLVTRPSGKASYTVTIMPIGRQGELFDLQRVRAVALITDPASIPLPGAVLLQGLFGFTAAESEVARLLMQGLDRREIAERLSVSLNTVRAHLRSLFSKTGTPSQAKLLRLLLAATRTAPDLTQPA